MKFKILKISIPLICLIAFSIYSMQDIYSYRDDMTIKRTLVEGEIPDLEGLGIDLLYDQSNFWYSTLKLGSEFKYDTEFHYTHRNMTKKLYFHLINGVYTSNHSHYQGGIPKNDKEAAKKQVIKRIESDERSDLEKEIIIEMIKNDESYKIVKLKDYFEYFPIVVGRFGIYNVKDYPVEETLNYKPRLDDYFKFPVCDVALKYDIKMDDGEFEVGTKVLAPYDEYPIFDMYSSVDSKNLNTFMSFSSTDFYQIPSEYNAVFTMPLKAVKNVNNRKNNSYDYVYDTNDIKKIYDLKDSERVCNMTVFEKSNKLYLRTEYKKLNYVYIFDTNNFELLDTVELYPNKEVYRTYLGKNGLLFDFDGDDYQWIMDEDHEIISLRIPKDLIINMSKKGYDMRDFVYYDDKFCVLFHSVYGIALGVFDELGNYSIINYDIPKRKGKDLDYHTDVYGDIKDDKSYQIWQSNFCIY